MSSEAWVAALVALALVLAALSWSIVMVGQVAEEFQEDPARWRALMLPFGLFGPWVARVILSRRGGGPGGYA